MLQTEYKWIRKETNLMRIYDFLYDLKYNSF